MVHVEELFEAVAKFQRAIHQANADGLYRKPAQWEKTISGARDEFKSFCLSHDLPVDFSER